MYMPESISTVFYFTLHTHSHNSQKVWRRKWEFLKECNRHVLPTAAIGNSRMQHILLVNGERMEKLTVKGSVYSDLQKYILGQGGAIQRELKVMFVEVKGLNYCSQNKVYVRLCNFVLTCSEVIQNCINDSHVLFGKF